MSSHTRTYTHTVEGGASATNDSIPDGTTLNKCISTNGTFTSISPNILAQATGIKCHLQLDVVKNSAAAANSILNNTALAEVIRSAAAEEENDAAGSGTSTVKSVYIRVEFNN